MKKSFFISMCIAFMVLLLPLTASGQFFYMQNEHVGKEVKDFTLKLLNKEETSLNDFREGKKSIIFFWATWCPHCRVQLGELGENKKRLEEDNIKIVLVDVGETEATVDKYVKKAKVLYDVFLDFDSVVAEDYGIVGVPTFYFIDEEGIVKDVKHSLPDDLSEVFSNT